MKTSLRFALAPLLCAVALAGTPEQPAESNTTWKSVLEQLPALKGSVKAQDAARAAALVQAADQVKTYAAANPGTAEAAEAKELEALYLIKAVEAGDRTQETRLRQLVKTIRQDSTMPVHRRYVVASRANELEIRQTPKMDHARRLAAYEKSARDMIENFPAEPVPYGALLALARDAEDDKAGVALAREVAAMAGAPAEVQARAKELVARREMLGKPLDLEYRTLDGKKSQLADDRGQPVAIYAWSQASKGSQAQAAKLEKLADGKVRLIGINCDLNIPAAIAMAKKQNLPGRLVFDPSGTIAQTLHDMQPGDIYLIDGEGTLNDDRGQNGLAKKLAALIAKGSKL